MGRGLRWIRAGLGAVLLAGVPGLAAAQCESCVTVCNVDDRPLDIAFGLLSGGQWSSWGITSLESGACNTMTAFEQGTGAAYFIDDPAFVAGGQMLCVAGGDFWIEDQQSCPAQGGRLEGFRLLDFVRDGRMLNLQADGTLVPMPRLPVLDLSRPVPQAPPAGGAWESGLELGALGDWFELEGVFQGCGDSGGTYFCGFHAEGWKFFAYDGGPTPRVFLDRLAQGLAPGQTIRVRGDVLSQGDISAEVALVSVEAIPDAFADLRAGIQGDWTSADDAQYRMTVSGSEIYEYYGAEQTGTRFLRLMDSCAESAGTGPVMVTTMVPGFETACFLLGDGLPSQLVLYPAGQGGAVIFVRP